MIGAACRYSHRHPLDGGGPARMLCWVSEDRALLLVGFAGGFRRSELVSLNVGDFEFAEDGLVVRLRRSKTDQEGAGRKVGIPFGANRGTCPVRSLKAWMEESGIERGAVFRPINRHGQVRGKRLSDKAVALIVKRAAESEVGLGVSRTRPSSKRATLEDD